MLGQFDQHFSIESLFIISVIAVFVIWFLFRRAGVIRSDSAASNLPASAPLGSKKSRWAETVLLFCVTGTIFVFIATSTSTGGRLLVLDRLNPAFASVNIIVAVCIGVCLLLCILICYFGQASVATIMVGLVLVIYATLLNGPGELLERMAGEKGGERKVTWTINIGGCDVKGAELWVNGVRLGTLPYTTTPEEFKAKVPYWPEEPAEMKNKEDDWIVPSYSPWSSRGKDHNGSRWADFVMPGESSKYWGKHYRDSKEEEKARTYYAQFKYAGEWGYSSGTSGGGSGGKYIYHTNTFFKGVRFPEREKRLETLFDKARLADYSPGDGWFEALETFGEDAVIAIRLLVEIEPQMENILEQWAIRKYNLDQVADRASAWKAFENICTEADTRKFYSTADIAGKAVEMLIPMLDPETLSKRAIKIIRSSNNYGWYRWQLAGKQHFGFADRPEGLRTGAKRTMGEWRGGGRDKLPMHAYALAHAIWKMDEYLDAKDCVNENIIEQKVVPQFLAQNYNDINRIKLAIPIGSIELDKFLIRQNWRTDAENLPRNERLRLQGREINGWLYLLSKLKSPTGDEFRRTQSRLIMQMADSSMERSDMDAAEELGFLFVDLDKGKESMAYRYWPGFSKLSRKHKHYEIQMRYIYLIKMEPVSTVEMYVKALQEFHGGYSDASTAFSKLKKLPEPKKEKVCLALKAALNEDTSNITGWSGSDKNGARDFLLRKLEWILSKQMLAEKVLNDLHCEKPNATPETVGLWLANAEPSHPLIAILAEDENPSLRRSVLDAVKAHPTPENRTILQKLVADDNERVRSAAEETVSELKILTRMASAEFVSSSIAK